GRRPRHGPHHARRARVRAPPRAARRHGGRSVRLRAGRTPVRASRGSFREPRRGRGIPGRRPVLPRLLARDGRRGAGDARPRDARVPGEEGLLYRHAGRGTFSTPSAGADPKLRVIGSVGDMMALGDETWFKLVASEIVPVPANIAQALRLPPRSSVYRISGVRHADNGPFQHVTAYVPLTIGTALSDEDLSKTSPIGAIER